MTGKCCVTGREDGALGSLAWHHTGSDMSDHTRRLHPLVVQCTSKDEAQLGLTYAYHGILVIPHANPDDGDTASVPNVDFRMITEATDFITYYNIRKSSKSHTLQVTVSLNTSHCPSIQP